MKNLRRYCSVLCCCLLLSAVFCTTANAEIIETPTIMYNEELVVSRQSNGDIIIEDFFDFATNNGVTEKTSIFSGNLPYTPNEKVTVTHTISLNDTTIGTTIIPKGKQINFELQKMAYSIWLSYNQEYITLADSVRLLLFYEDGSMQYVDDVAQTNDTTNKYRSTLTANFLPVKNVVKVEIIMQKTFAYQSHTIYLGESDGTHEGWYLVLDQQTKSEGLLGGLLEWVKNLFNKVTEGFSALGDGITNVFNKLGEGFQNLGEGLTNLWNSILELPAKLWELISNGLKSLFVPAEDFIVNFKDDIDEILSNKLGAVYQVVNILGDSWDRIQSADENNTIDFPKSTIGVGSGVDFSFGGYAVKIVPDGFEWLATAVKMLAGIVCTILFINGLRKKYDEVMGVEQ